MSARILPAAIVAVLGLVGCGSDDDGNDTPPEGPVELTASDGKVYDQAGWTTETDALTGREFRCLTLQSSFKAVNEGGRGLAVFCYDANEAQP